jgi:hypothetical protein
MTRSPQIFLTNDDGVSAPGLAALARALRPGGEVTVIAPEHNWSAGGHSKTMHKPLRVSPARLADGEPALAGSGSPSDCVALALLGLAGGAAGPGDLGHQHRRQRGQRPDLFGHRLRRHGGRAERRARRGRFYRCHLARRLWAGGGLCGRVGGAPAGGARRRPPRLLNSTCRIAPCGLRGVQVTRRGAGSITTPWSPPGSPRARLLWIGGDLPRASPRKAPISVPWRPATSR